MKRTTYIIIGMLIAGVVVVISCVIYSSMQVVKWDDIMMTVGGEKKTVQLPECKAVKLVMEREVLKIRKNGIIEIRMANFYNLPLDICHAPTANGTLTYASDMDKFMTLKTSNDTLTILFNFSKDKLEKKYQNMQMLNVQSKAMTLTLPTNIQSIVSNLEGQKTTFRDLNRDTLFFSVNDADIANCRFRALCANKGTVNFRSGEVENLHLQLDRVRYWKANADSFHIDTAYLYARGREECALDKECRQVVWMPQSEKASLNLRLKGAASVTVK